MANFRTRKYTSRITPISQQQINRLRATRLKNATTSAQKKFFNSKSFDKRIRANIRSNRAEENSNTLDKIVSELGGTKEKESVVRSIFGERIKLVNGKKVRINSFTSVSQTKRLKRVQMNISKNKFNFSNYVSRSQSYKDIKQYLPDSSTTNDIVYALSRGGFYFENQNLIIKHNTNVSKYGYFDAQTKLAGKNLRNKHYETQNQENQEFIDFLDKK